MGTAPYRKATFMTDVTQILNAIKQGASIALVPGLGLGTRENRSRRWGMPARVFGRRFMYAAILAVAAVAWCMLLSAVLRAAEPQQAEKATTFSLTDDFSYSQQRADSTWSYRLDDTSNRAAVFPLLPSADRDVNGLWGSNFPNPPRMWSDVAGYWGIGKNLTGKALFSSRNDTTWAPGEVLLHPKGGDSPNGLVIGWTAPRRMRVDVRYTFALAARQTNGVGFRLTQRIGRVDTEVVAVDNIGESLTNSLTGIAVAKGDQLFFRVDTCGDPGGDIVRANTHIQAAPAAAGSPRPYGGTVGEGSDFTFHFPATGARTFEWRKNGQAVVGANTAVYRIRDVKTSDAGVYSVVVDAAPSGDAVLNVTPCETLAGTLSVAHAARGLRANSVRAGDATEDQPSDAPIRRIAQETGGRPLPARLPLRQSR